MGSNRAPTIIFQSRSSRANWCCASATSWTGAAPSTEAAAGSIRFGAFRFDLDRNELFRGDELVHLTSAEAGLLASLASRAGEAVSREDLSQSAAFSGNTRNVDVQMTRLRRKIEPDPRYPRYLQTVRGTGYALKPE